MPKMVGVVVVANNLHKLLKGINTIAQTRVMVGVPGTKAGRREGPINNASLAYIHEHGDNRGHIPARPFLAPGIASVQEDIEQGLRQAGLVALAGNPGAVDRALNRVGIIGRDAVKKKITEGIPPPLAESTIKARTRRVKGKKRRQKIEAALAAGTPASVQGGAEGIFTPLVLSGQLRNSISYVLRRDDKR